ncbi:hypothetical protein GGR56DRAFT_347823 [Xylariaceae sp. FL0804]|nr:hypothetical protein GGR56DRAFT_347823 [Xylariaceae sp. FL0804]
MDGYATPKLLPVPSHSRNQLRQKNQHLSKSATLPTFFLTFLFSLLSSSFLPPPLPYARGSPRAAIIISTYLSNQFSGPHRCRRGLSLASTVGRDVGLRRAPMRKEKRGWEERGETKCGEFSGRRPGMVPVPSAARSASATGPGGARARGRGSAAGRRRCRWAAAAAAAAAACHRGCWWLWWWLRTY